MKVGSRGSSDCRMTMLGPLMYWKSRCLEDPRSSLLWDLIRFMQWWFVYQHSPLRYIFKNVSLFRFSQDMILEGRRYVCQHLGDLIFVDIVKHGSDFPLPWWLWTNLAPLSTLLATMSPPSNQKVDDILDPNRISLPIVRDNLPPLALVNKVRVS